MSAGKASYTKSSLLKSNGDKPYTKRGDAEDDSVSRPNSPVTRGDEAGYGSDAGSAVEDGGITDFSEEHMKEVSSCWGIYFNLVEHGPMRRTEKTALQALRDAGKTKQFLLAAKANERNARIGKAVRELLKMAKEQGSVSALEKCKKLLHDTEEGVKRICAETKESFIPRSAARTGSKFTKDNLDVKSLFQ